jgi:hypothetical protein
MNDPKYKNLVENAKILCDMTQRMQDILLELFFDDFIEIDEEEDRMKLLCQDPPF